MAGEIILYDLPTRSPHPQCWNPNTWKARAALNLKSLPYQTLWIEYPDLAPTFSSFGIPSNPVSESPWLYAAPATRLPDGSYVMDSRAIALALDKLYPEPSLHMHEGAAIDRAQAAVIALITALAAVIVPRPPKMVLGERSADYFRRTREVKFGMALAELGASEVMAEEAWEGEGLVRAVEELRGVLREREGEFVGGQEVGFADFVLGGGCGVFSGKL